MGISILLFKQILASLRRKMEYDQVNELSQSAIFLVDGVRYRVTAKVERMADSQEGKAG